MMEIDFTSNMGGLLSSRNRNIYRSGLVRSKMSTKEEEEKMKKFDMNSVGKRMIDRFFKRVDDVTWDLMTGQIGVRTSDGIVTLDGAGADATVKLNVMDDFGIPLPAFAQNTAPADIKVGDLIYGARAVMGWVVKRPTAKGKVFKLLRPDGTSGEWRPPTVTSIGIDLNGAMVLRSLINTLPEGGLGNMQNMLLPLLVMGDGDAGGMDDMLPLLLMSQCGMGGLGGDAGGGMMQTMLMMKMLGGRGAGGSGSFFDRNIR